MRPANAVLETRPVAFERIDVMDVDHILASPVTNRAMRVIYFTRSVLTSMWLIVPIQTYRRAQVLRLATGIQASLNPHRLPLEL